MKNFGDLKGYIMKQDTPVLSFQYDGGVFTGNQYTG